MDVKPTNVYSISWESICAGGCMWYDRQRAVKTIQYRR